MERDLGGAEERCSRPSGGSAYPPVGLGWQLLLSPSRAPPDGRRKDYLAPPHLVPGLCGGLGWQRDPNSFIFWSRTLFLKVTVQRAYDSEMLWEAPSGFAQFLGSGPRAIPTLPWC